LANPSNPLSSYFDNIKRIAAEDYVPSQHDIMLLDTKITDLSDTTFFDRGRVHRFFEFDAGQARQDLPQGPISALIAFVDLSTYCRPVTSGDDTYGPFNEIMEFFNKLDIFVQRFTLSTFKNHFRDYDGPQDHDRAIRHLFRLGARSGAESA
jgi:guanine nucleotide-binding protein subunit alpha